MTQEEFNAFIKKHKVLKIEPSEIDGHTIYFDNNEWINVGAGYDGIVYSHHYVGEPKYDTRGLLKDFINALPDQINKLELKYGSNSGDALNRR